MTDAALPRGTLPHSAHNGIAPTLVPSAVLCALVVATGASYIHWSKPAPLATPMLAEPLSTPVRTWVIERPRAESKIAGGPDAAALAAATQKLAKAATVSAERMSATASQPPAGTGAAKIVVAKADIGQVVEAAPSGPRVVPPLPTAATPTERVPLPPQRPAFLRTPKDDLIPPQRPAALAPSDEAQPQRPAALAPPAQEPVAPPLPVVAAPPREEAVAPPRDETPRQRRRRLARQTPASQAAPEDKRNALEKLLGLGETQQRPKAASAYAPQDGGLLGGLFGGGRSSSPSISSGGGTAIYDISAHTVYLPDGRQLEAHSGLGQHLDDPRSANTPNRGATPPNTYDLSLRESPFHGVRALRLNPVGSGGTYGRNGLLAHTFMLGPRGDSNGCVVFRDYNAFLQAFDSGAIKRLQVVSSR